jgi:hypothetical protein
MILLGKIVFAVLIVVLCGCPMAFAGVITIGVVPGSQSVTLGSPVNMALNIQGLGEPPSIGTFDVTLDFDPTILSFASATFGDPILGDQLDPTGGGNTINFFTLGAGSIELFDLSLDSAADLNALQASSFSLVGISFSTVGSGSSLLTLSVNALGDENGDALSASLQSGSVDVNTASDVPEPTTVTLGALGVLVGVLLRHRRVL